MRRVTVCGLVFVAILLQSCTAVFAAEFAGLGSKETVSIEESAALAQKAIGQEVGKVLIEKMLGNAEVVRRLPVSESDLLKSDGDFDYFTLGIRYFFGMGATEDKSKGIYYLKKSADRGHSLSKEMLALLILNFRGDLISKTEAFTYLLSAAEQSGSAQFMAGVSYWHGTGVKKDIALAIKWLEKAAEGQIVAAQSVVGLLYLVDAERNAGPAPSSPYGENRFEIGYFWLTVAAINDSASYKDLRGLVKGELEGKKFRRAIVKGSAAIGSPGWFSEIEGRAARWVESRGSNSTPPAAPSNVRTFVGKGKIGRMPTAEDFYPSSSKAAGHQGKTTIRVCINPDAQIESTEVIVSSGHQDLDAAALDLARAGRYYPEKVADGAIASCVSFAVKFSISGDEDPTPLAELARAAEAGSAAAQVKLGFRYSRGDGVARDDAEAFKWFSAAAEQGFATGQLNVGVSYHNGNGVEKDPKKAEQYYLLAANQGSTTAAKYLGYLYKDGDLGKRNPVEAAKWLKKAAEKRDKDAAYSLGWIYFRGGIVPQKTPDAYFWFLVAERLGHPDAERLRRKAAQATSPADIDEAQKMMLSWERATPST